MNALYHIAIIEGFLGQHQHLPKNVQDAIEFLKHDATPKPAAPAQVAKKRKKTKQTPEQRERMLAHLAKMRSARGIVDLTTEQKAQIFEMRKQGKTREEIATAIGRSVSRVDTILYNK